MRRPALHSALLSVFSLLGSGCDALDSAGAKIVVAGLLIKAPEIKVAGRFDLPSETGATVWVAERMSATDTSEPTPISGAEVAITFAGNRVPVPADSMQKGLYTQSSMNSALIFAAGTAYSFEAKIPSDSAGSYGGIVRMAPTELTPAALTLTPQPSMAVPGLPEVGVHGKNTALKLAWGTQFGRYAFVTVLRADQANPGEPRVVFDSRPKTAQEIIQFVAGTPPTSIDIPGSTFAEDGVYAVVLVALEKGEPLANTFLGSPLLVGSGAPRFLAVGMVN